MSGSTFVSGTPYFIMLPLRYVVCTTSRYTHVPLIILDRINTRRKYAASDIADSSSVPIDVIANVKTEKVCL